jgi:NADH-quinone oxidoreductase subunit H
MLISILTKMFIIKTIAIYLSAIVPLLISVAYFTLYERQILAALQRRQGPNMIGYYGLFQPLADGLKLFLKESILPKSANTFLFILSPVFTFALAIAG